MNGIWFIKAMFQFRAQCVSTELYTLSINRVIIGISSSNFQRFKNNKTPFLSLQLPKMSLNSHLVLVTAS